MNYNSINQNYSSAAAPAESQGRYVAKTFGWMFAGLLLTFLIAYTGYVTRTIVYVFTIPYAHFVLLIAEVGVVVFLSARIHKMSVGAARVLFFVYAALNGIVFSAYFLMFEMSSLIVVFGASAAFFGIMAVVGYVTNADFSKIRNFLYGGVLFLAAFWVLSMFLNLERFEIIVCYIGIFIFLVLTAYDTNKIKDYYHHYSQVPDMAAKASIFSALQLYLDFINLFIYLLRIVGKRR